MNGMKDGQRTLEWFRARLGKITGSRVGVLMGKGKGSEFTKTGLSYLNTVAAELMLPAPVVADDELFAVYLDEVDITTKAMRIGTEREEEARELYEALTQRLVTETGCMESENVAGFASSPDGLILDGDAVEGAIEIKCPKPATYLEYLSEVKDAETLLKVNPEYYWQCVSHIEVSGAAYCDFIAYCPYNRKPLHIVRIERNEEALSKLHERVGLALDYLSDMIADLIEEPMEEAV